MPQYSDKKVQSYGGNVELHAFWIHVPSVTGEPPTGGAECYFGFDMTNPEHVFLVEDVVKPAIAMGLPLEVQGSGALIPGTAWEGPRYVGFYPLA